MSNRSLNTFVVLLASTLTFACQASVTRVNDGTAVRGRPIAPKAYAAYLRGRLLEQEGQLKAAETEYEATLALDSKASDALIRLGAIRCQSKPNSSNSAFEQAEAISPNAVNLWQERAICALKAGKTKLAVESAKLALRLAPDDPQNSYLLIVTYNRDKQPASARVLAWSLVSRNPRDSYAWELLSSLYSGQHRQALRDEAAIRTFNTGDANRYPLASRPTVLPALNTPTEPKTADAPEQPQVALISALYAGDVKAVSHAARQLRLTSLRLSIRAFELGAYDIAYSEALRAFRVAPDNADAWTLTLVLADLLGKAETIAELLQQDVPRVGQLDPVVETALEQLTARHLGLTTP